VRQCGGIVGPSIWVEAAGAPEPCQLPGIAVTDGCQWSHQWL